jgi:hypothetical protein
MLSEFLSVGRVLPVTAACLFFAGCTADRYFMVERQDMDNLNNSLLEQQYILKSLDSHNRQSLETLLYKTDSNRDAILQAIEEKVQAPECPPVPDKNACDVAADAEARGRADRLRGKVVVGEKEQFLLMDPGLIYEARVDSGAETSSLDARNVTRFERDGQNWVRFDIPHPSGEGMVTLEREVSRRVRIISASAEDSERRVVVDLQFMIGNHQQEAEFTLTNRENLSHRVLIGRNILRDVMLIDVGKEFATTLPNTVLEDTGQP